MSQMSKSKAGGEPDITAMSLMDTLAALRVNSEVGLTRSQVETQRKEHG